MERILLKIKPKYYAIVAFCLGGLAMYMMLSYAQLLSTGKYCILEGDLFEMYVPYIKMFARDILNGQSIWFSWSNSMGMNTSLSYAFYAMSPINILYLIFYNVDEAVVTGMVIVLKTALAASFFQIFASKVLKCKGLESIVFSIFYALCAFQIVYNVLNIIWMDAVYMLPLICFFIVKLVKEKKWIGLVISYAYLFISQFYIGYMVGIFSFLFFVCWMILSQQESKRKICKTTLSYIGCVLFAIALSAVVWLPAGLFLLQNNASDATDFQNLSITILDIINNLFWGEMQDYTGTVPYIYCGIPVLLIFPFYFVNKEISKKERIVVFALGLFLIASCLWLPLYKMMHAFDAPDSFGYRFSFLISFYLLAVTCRQFKYLSKVPKRSFAILIFVYIAFYALEQQVQTIANTANCTWRLLINILLMFSWGVLIIIYQDERKRKVSLAIGVLLLALVETVGNGESCIYKSEETKQQTIQHNYDTWKHSMEEAIKRIQDNDHSVYRITYTNDFIHNSDSWFGYMGLSDFCTAENPILRNTMQQLGFFTSPRLTYQYGQTPVTNMLFSVKYQANGVVPYALSQEKLTADILENNNALKLGFMVNEKVILNSVSSNNVFENMNELLTDMTRIEQNCFVPIESNKISSETYNMDVYEYDGHVFIKRQISNAFSSRLTYFVPTEEGKTAYVQFEQDMSVNDPSSPVLLGGDENTIEWEGRLTSSYAKEMIPNGDVCSVTIESVQTTYQESRFTKANFYYFDPSVLQLYYDELSQNQMEISEFKDGYVKATVSVPADKTVLFTSIPYDKGWSVTANGQKVETKAVVGDAFLAVPLGEGDYELEFQYTAPGSKIGIIVSSISGGLLMIGIIYTCLSRKKKLEENNVSNRSIEN